MKIFQQHYPQFNLYAARSSRESPEIEGVTSIYPDSDIPYDQFEIAFITNPSVEHIPTAISCAKNGLDLFIEKPLSTSLELVEELEELVNENKLITYVAYNLRYHPVIKYLKSILKDNMPYYYRCITTSYLPHWRQNQDYRKSYSARENMSGGILFDLSHELDYMHWLDPIESLSGRMEKLSKLDIEATDTADLILKHKNITGTIHLDFHSKINQREIILYFEDKTIRGDLLANRVEIFGDEVEIIPFNEYNLKLSYIDQVNDFISCVKARELPDNHLGEAKILLNKIVKNKIVSY